MEPETFERLTEIFEHARTLGPGERNRYLDGACGDEPELRARVLTLLAQHDRDGLLDDPIRIEALSPEPIPERVGHYRILGPLGRGGMGVVYRAEQEHPRRQVAIKMVHAGLLTPELRRRFEFESSVLARLQHPGIAKIFEVGTWDDGRGERPFFAMELAEGLTLDEYLERERPTTETRLRLFMAVCDAVHHAHQKGVIHRDLKPHNILVSDRGTPKILDFGVARATDADVLATRQTQAGQLIGTLAYMSPEQISASAEALDTRSDVYALGVILYELLAGRLPYDLTRGSVASAARIIEDTQPASLTTINRTLRGDLNTITLKALRKDPERRYQSASDLAADLGRYLNHEPISARPATVWYQSRRFARRHRGLVAGMVGVVLALVLGSAGIAWQATRVSAEAQTRREVAMFLREMLTSIDPAKTGGEPLTVRDMLDDAAATLPERFARSPQVRGELHDTVGLTYYRLGEFEAAERHQRLAIEDHTNRSGARSQAALRAAASLGLTLKQLGRLDEAERVLLDARSRLGSANDPAAGYVTTNLAIVLHALGPTDEAEALYRENYRQSLSSLGPDNPGTLLAQNNLGTLFMEQGRHDEALVPLEDCLTRRRKILGEDHPHTITSLANLAGLHGLMGREDEARAMLLEAAERSERVLGPVHLSTLLRRKNVVISRLRAGDFAEGAIQARALLEVCVARLDAAHPERLGAVEITVTALALSGDVPAAEALALESHTLVESEHGPTHRATGRAAMLLVNLYEETGDSARLEIWRQRVEATDFSPEGAPG